MAAELQVRAPGAGPWVLAGLAATLVVEVLIAPFAFVPGVVWLPLLAILVAVVSPLAITVAILLCRRHARRRSLTRSDVTTLFVVTGCGALVATPALISLVFAIAALLSTGTIGLLQVLGGILAFAIFAEIFGVVLGIIPALVLATLAGVIVSRVAFRPERHPRACPEDP